MRTTYGSKRFLIRDIKSTATVLLGSNDSGKTRSLSALKQALEEREQPVIHINVLDYKEPLFPEKVDKVLRKLREHIPKEGYLLIDNLDRVLTYSAMLNFMLYVNHNMDINYRYIILTSSSYDLVTIVSEVFKESSFWNNETGRFITTDLGVYNNYVKLFKIHSKELGELMRDASSKRQNI